MRLCIILLLVLTNSWTAYGAPKPFLSLRWAQNSVQPAQGSDLSGVPALPFPVGGNAQNCPNENNNLFNQGIQKRSLPHSRRTLNVDLDTQALAPRQYSKCTNVARFDWQDFRRPLGNTQDIYLYGGLTYTFSIACSANIGMAYAWSAPFGSPDYTLIGTGGDGSQTATVIIKLESDAHVHFEAFSKETLTSGRAAVFRQDP